MRAGGLGAMAVFLAITIGTAGYFERRQRPMEVLFPTPGKSGSQEPAAHPDAAQPQA